VPFSVHVDGTAADTAEVAAHATGGSFLNFLHDTTATRRAYSDGDWNLLRNLKRVWDPENVFGRIHNIAPAERESLGGAGFAEAA